jgi:guanine nucleotide-binding protein subunit alpha, other
MMCFGRRDKDDGGMSRSRELDKIIRQDEKRLSKEVKLLLLGAGESGKSTVLKQMKLIYAQGFSKTEKLEWKPVVFNNVVQAFRLIFEAMNELDIPFENPENEASFRPPSVPRHGPPHTLLPSLPCSTGCGFADLAGM